MSPDPDFPRIFRIVVRLEAEMFQRVLGVPVERTEQIASALYACTFHLRA